MRTILKGAQIGLGASVILGGALVGISCGTTGSSVDGGAADGAGDVADAHGSTDDTGSDASVIPPSDAPAGDSSGGDAPDDAVPSDGAAGGDAPDDAVPSDGAAPFTYYDITDPQRWSAFNLSKLADAALSGFLPFAGAIFDGRYVYFSPSGGTNFPGSLGVVVRYDTTQPFASTSSWSSFDLHQVTPAATSSLGGGVFDGRYLYLPCGATVVRYDTTLDFASAASWTTFVPGQPPVNPPRFFGALFDGHYAYFAPAPDTIAQYDTSLPFRDGASWKTFATPLVAGGVCPTLFCQAGGGVFDGHDVYVVPGTSAAAVVRYDRTQDFESKASWTAFDGGSPREYEGAVFDGRFVYLVPLTTGLVDRFDTTMDFGAPGSWSSFDSATINPSGRGAYKGGAFDGRYVYFVPGTEPQTGLATFDLARYDTTRDFKAQASWSAFDTATIANSTNQPSYAGAAFDGHYLYLVPTNSVFVLRFEARSPGALPTTSYGGSFL
jgi:hypothetical protein